MGISRASVHKRRLTGGKRKPMRKKRKFEMGRPPAMTKLGPKRIRIVRGRGGNLKRRALRLEAGNFSWGTEATTRRTRILGVVYNASNNELVRTNTLVKNSIIQIEATPFRVWYEQHYGVTIGKKKKEIGKEEPEKEKDKDSKKSDKQKDKEKDSKKSDKQKDKDSKKSSVVEEPKTSKSKRVISKLHQRQQKRQLESAIEDQFSTGRLLACISSRPGQSGRCDGYILEGKELEFYSRKIQKRKSARS